VWSSSSSNCLELVIPKPHRMSSTVFSSNIWGWSFSDGVAVELADVEPLEAVKFELVEDARLDGGALVPLGIALDDEVEVARFGSEVEVEALVEADRGGRVGDVPGLSAAPPTRVRLLIMRDLSGISLPSNSASSSREMIVLDKLLAVLYFGLRGLLATGRVGRADLAAPAAAAVVVASVEPFVAAGAASGEVAVGLRLGDFVGRPAVEAEEAGTPSKSPALLDALVVVEVIDFALEWPYFLIEASSLAACLLKVSTPTSSSSNSSPSSTSDSGRAPPFLLCLVVSNFC